MQAIIISCECGSSLSPSSYHKHKKSSLHARRLSALQDNDVKHTPNPKTPQQKEKNKLYQQREDIKARRAEKQTCICGAIVSRGNMYHHLLTQLHQNNLSNNSRKARRAEKLPCECGAMVSRGNMKNHLIKSRHLNNLKLQEEKKQIIKCSICPGIKIKDLDEHNKSREHHINKEGQFMQDQMDNHIINDDDDDYDVDDI